MNRWTKLLRERERDTRNVKCISRRANSMLNIKTPKMDEVETQKEGIVIDKNKAGRNNRND